MSRIYLKISNVKARPHRSSLAVSANPLRGVLLVRAFQSNGLTSRPGFATREAGGAIRRDFFDKFSEPPPVSPANRFVRDLATARAARQVARPGSRLEQDGEIEGNVEPLEMDRAASRPAGPGDALDPGGPLRPQGS
ncbi:MAG: hypothetical protein KF791_00775 [Verrucomicrobiae bacterium]|nr:hypothetical protein [Verrucomicrobiae bacterium]